MNLYQLSSTEALRNLRQNLLLYVMVAVVLSASVAIFISSIEIVASLDAKNLNYQQPQQLKYIHLKNSSKQFEFFESREQQISVPIIKHFIDAYQQPNFAYMTVKMAKVSPLSQNISQNNNQHKTVQQRIDYVSANFFAVLGVKPLLGSLPDASQNQIALSYEYWDAVYQQQDVLNQSLIIDANSYVVTAIMPAQFRSPISYLTDKIMQQKTSIWMPFANASELFSDSRNVGAVLMQRSTDTEEKFSHDLNAVYAKIRDLDEFGRDFSIESGALSDVIYGTDTQNSLNLFYFALFLFIVSIISVVILLSTNTVKSAQLMAMKSMLGASPKLSGLTQKFEYAFLLLAIFVLTLPLIVGFKHWIKQLDFLNANSDFSMSPMIKLAIIVLVFATVYAIFIFMPKLKLAKVQLVDAIKGNFFNHYSKRFFGVRLLLFIQATVAVVLLYLAFVLVLDTFENYKNLNRMHLKDKISIQLKTPENNNMEIYQKALELKSQLLQLQGVEAISMATASPLSLIGQLMDMSNNYEDPNAVEKLSANVYKVLDPDAKKVDLKISLIYVENNFFDLFKVHFVSGHNFTDNTNEVVLIQQQLHNIVDKPAGDIRIGMYLPGDPLADDWSPGIVLAGTINNISVFENNLISAFFKSYNLAFKLLNFNSVKLIDFKTLSFVLQSPTPDAIDIEKIKALVNNYEQYFEFESVYNLVEEANRIIAKSAAKTLSALFLSVLALLLILFGSFGLVNSICQKMFKEIGIRLTVGARNYDIVKMVLAKVLMPSFYAIVLTLAVIFILNILFNLLSIKITLYFLPFVLMLIGFILLAILLPLRKLLNNSVSEFIHVAD